MYSTGEGVPVHVVKSYGGSSSTAPLILYLVVSWVEWPLPLPVRFTTWERIRVPIEWDLG
jgi:hypothetical protein